VAPHTKVRLEPAEVRELVARALGGGARVAAARELRGGSFNACWSVTLASGAERVLKVAPPPALPLLRYETDLLRTEVDFYARAGAAGLPVPEVAGADFTRSACASDYFVMTRVPGRPLLEARRRLSREERAAVRRQLGRAAARLGAIRRTGSHGYDPPGARASRATWRAAFEAMLGNLLADAARWKVRLPRPAAELEALVSAHARALDAVNAPHLVHFDLWDGNVFVDGAAGEARLSGLIDGERAFWGDPLFELPSLALFGEIEDDEPFLVGYAEEQGRPLVFDEPARTRVALGQLYLYLIMWIEPAPRAFGPVKRAATRLYVGRFLRRALRRLERGA